MSIAYFESNTTEAAARASEEDAPTSVTLDRLSLGASARVIAVNGEGAVARRLMEMGVVPGAPVRVVKAAPLGDPLEVRVRGYRLALRREEARTITVAPSGEI